MKFGRIVGGFEILPRVSVNWMTFCGERHYSLQFAWLWWYVSTFRTQQQIVDRYIDNI